MTITADTRPDRAGQNATQARCAVRTCDALESEAIHILREVAGEFDRPVILFSGGKDSVLVLHLALKAFDPAPLPFSLLHVDTGHNFPEVLAYRDRVVAEQGLRLQVAKVQDWIDDGRLTERPDGTRNPLQTVPAARHHRRRAVRRGDRRRPPRRGTVAGQGADLLAAGRVRRLGPAPAAPGAVGAVQRPARAGRARPGVPAVQLDRAGRLALHRARGHRAAARSTTRTSARCSSAAACGWRRASGAARRAARRLERRQVRYRTVGDMSCTGAVDSDATDVARGHRRDHRHPDHRAGRHPRRRQARPRPRWKTASARGTSDERSDLDTAAAERRIGGSPTSRIDAARTGGRADDGPRAAAVRDRRFRRRRQVHPGRPAAARLQVGAGRHPGRRAAHLGGQRSGRPSTSRCWSTGCARNAMIPGATGLTQGGRHGRS